MTDGFVIENGVLVAYTLREISVAVPKGVTVIGPGAFKGCTGIEQVWLPDSVTAIMENGFKGCRQLREIRIPAGLTYVGDYAFHRCHKLKEIELPAAVKEIGRCAFLFCDSLETAWMPGVVKLGNQAFVNDVALRSIEVSEQLETGGIVDVFIGCGSVDEIRLSDGQVFSIDSLIDVISEPGKVHKIVREIAVDIFRMMEISDRKLVKFLTNIKEAEVPEGIVSLERSCFFDKKGIIKIKLPASVREIKKTAFRNCINLERIELGGDQIQISSDAFKNCTTLRYVVTADGTEYELKGLPDQAEVNRPETVRAIHAQLLGNFLITGTILIRYIGSEERVVVPEGITVIGERAFAGNEAVGRVVLPESIREIREEAFEDCLLLQTINLPVGLTVIGRSAFENCLKLIRAELPEALTVIEKSVFNRCKKLGSVTFGKTVTVIGEQAFYRCESLKSLDFPERLEEIGHMAFYHCISLTGGSKGDKGLILPGTLRRLGNNVFTGAGVRQAVVECDPDVWGTDIFSQCGKLRKIRFAEGVRQIGNKFAYGCSKLLQIELPDSVMSVGYGALESSAFLNEIREDGIVGRILFDGSRYTGNAVIPEGVTVIAGGAFYENQQVIAVKLPASLRRIGARAFSGCRMLEKVTLPEQVTEIEERTFAYCDTLEAVVAEGKILAIGEGAFYGCREIQKVPSEYADSIGRQAFWGCKKLLNIKVSGRNIGEDAWKGTAFLARLQALPVVLTGMVIDGAGCGRKVVVPEGITCILPFAFAGNQQITGLVLPESLKEIGEGAFYGCRNLAWIQFPNEPVTIGARAFSKCTSLIEISLNANAIGRQAFSYCTRLKEAVLKSVSILPEEVFSGCEMLEQISCGAVQVLGAGSFSECEKLAAFDFTQVSWIGAGAFRSCNSLFSIDFAAGIMVGRGGFQDCGQLAKITLAEDALKFDSYAFSGCTALSQVQVEDIVYEFTGYGTLFNRRLPELVKAIYSSVISCFYIDENLTLFRYENRGRFIRIPAGVKQIGGEVFKDITGLEDIQVPSGVEYIGERAFHGTKWLEQKRSENPMVTVKGILVDGIACQGHVVIPETVRMVAGWAFANNMSLTGVTICSRRTIVREYAFRNCIHIKQVVDAERNVYQLSGIADRNRELPNLVKQIFTESLNCFKTDEAGVLVESTGNISDLVLADGIVAIGNRVFKESNLLTQITLSMDTTWIGAGAFEQCKWLEQVMQAENVRRIGRLAFSGCGRLRKLNLSEALQEIGERVFEHCTALEEIWLPEGITEIPEKAFYRCKSLKKVELPATVTRIGKEAFAFCSELKEICICGEAVHEGNRADVVAVQEDAYVWCERVLVESRAFWGCTGLGRAVKPTNEVKL